MIKKKKRLSRGLVNKYGIDRAFEVHRQAKLLILEVRAKTGHAKPAFSTGVSQLSLGADGDRNGSSIHLLSPPIGPRLAVAADDPCMFDATVWCENEYGGELEGLGGGSTASGGDGGDYDPATDAPNCGSIISKMNYALTQYNAARDRYFEMAGWVTDGPASTGVIEGMLMSQYDTMMSYYADYKLWWGLAMKYRCF